MSGMTIVYIVSIVMLFMVLAAYVVCIKEDLPRFKGDCMLIFGLFLIVIWIIVGAYIASSPSSTSPKNNGVRYYLYQPAYNQKTCIKFLY